MGKRDLLSAEDVARRLSETPHWKIVEQHHLARIYEFPDFQQALDFVNRVGAVAESQGHHPDIQLGWGRAAIDTWTHDAGGITEKDFQLAAAINALT